MPRTGRWVWGGGLFLAGLGLGWVIPHPPLSFQDREREEIGSSVLTSPFLECVGERDLDPGLVHARRAAEAYLDGLRASDPTLQVSVYARDLLNGPWIGIDEDRRYEPASLHKVSVLFHALSRLESSPSLKDSAFVYPGPRDMPSPDNLADRPAEEHMVPGTLYRFEELLERMIVFSDNHAKDLILSGVPPGEVDAFMAGIGLRGILDHGHPVVDARSYAALFRVLFNSSVFSRPTSEYALELLHRAKYREGLRAPIPGNVPVASKFGIHHQANGPADGAQFHECGIVYAPGGPYVLSVMTSSEALTPSELSGVVAEISRIFFQARPG